MDLDKYMEFVDQTTSRHSQTTADYKERIEELVAAGCNLARLDTAASGLVAEAGEFMEIVKKIKFQGKPWDEANKEHLQKELGDIMWYVAQAAMALNVRLDDVIYLNTIKLAARYPTGEFTLSTRNIARQVIFKIWKYALGSYSDDKTEPYDNYITAVRSIIFVSYLVTNCFIISGVIRHWNSATPDQCQDRSQMPTRSTRTGYSPVLEKGG